jgi:RHS repeat-associated protein
LGQKGGEKSRGGDFGVHVSAKRTMLWSDPSDYQHAASSLSLTLFRVYDPQIGRWLSRDPLGEGQGNNLFGYVNNNPFNAIDPDGRNAEVVAAGIVAVGLLVLAYLAGQYLRTHAPPISLPCPENAGKAEEQRKPLPIPIPIPKTAEKTDTAEDKKDQSWTYYHYSPLPNLTGLGLAPRSFVTDMPGLSYDHALLMSTASPVPVLYEYPVKVTQRTEMIPDFPVNGVRQWKLPQGTPAGTIGVPRPIPRG